MQDKSNPFRFGVAIVLCGALTGVLGGAFLIALRLMVDARVSLIDAAGKHQFPGWLAAAIAGLLFAAVAAWLAKLYAPDAPQLATLESADTSQCPTSVFRSITVNFAGTGLAVGAGLALGPERPAIQMSGAIGFLVGRLMGLSRPDNELLMASTGGAGIATMFNAPLGCAAYTMTVVLRRADLRISVTTLGIGAIAVAVAQILAGRDVIFLVGHLPKTQFEHLFLYFLLGCVIAVIGILHARIIRIVARCFQIARLPSVARGALIGAIIGSLAWFSPELVGTGESLTQEVIDGKFALSALTAIFLVRFFIGPLSIAAVTPGGYFTPVLALGALVGSVYGNLLTNWLPTADISPTAFALVGMGVALATVARAPFTGILLTMETADAFPMLLPMTIAVVGGAVVTQGLRSPSLGHGLERLREHLDKLIF